MTSIITTCAPRVVPIRMDRGRSGDTARIIIIPRVVRVRVELTSEVFQTPAVTTLATSPQKNTLQVYHILESLPRQFRLQRCAHLDSNQGHPLYKSGALPLSYRRVSQTLRHAAYTLCGAHFANGWLATRSRAITQRGEVWT